jgi:hypothetical protein
MAAHELLVASTGDLQLSAFSYRLSAVGFQRIDRPFRKRRSQEDG